MKTATALFTGLLLAVLTCQARAEDPVLTDILTRRNLEGTVVVASLDGDAVYVGNEARAKTRFPPASTFKIPNTLIALETGAVRDGTETIAWDGKDKGMAAWNRDQSIETALPSSCVWFYQELAKRVGLATYADFLKRLGYGNEKAGPKTTTFWLEGDPRISALEQITFLRKVVLRQLPFKASSYDLLQKIMLLEQTDAYALRGKTGWAVRGGPPVGWLVGWVETGSGTWLYAVNIAMPRIEDAPLRKEVVMQALRAKGIV